MIFSKEKPITPGWYWYRGDAGFQGEDDKKQCTVRIFEKYGKMLGYFSGWDVPEFIETIDGEFAGPIPEPKEMT